MTKIIIFGLAPWLLFMSAHFILPDLTIEKKAPGPLLISYQKRLKDKRIIFTEKRLIRAVCWYLKRDNIYVVGHGGELKYGLTYKENANQRMDLKPMADFIRKHPGQTVLIARMKKLNKWSKYLPQPIAKVNNGAKGVGIWKF
jgi:4-amino-4-deoxy-L-arabinose transferase